jgi:hypothetical protein
MSGVLRVSLAMFVDACEAVFPGTSTAEVDEKAFCYKILQYIDKKLPKDILEKAFYDFRDYPSERPLLVKIRDECAGKIQGNLKYSRKKNKAIEYQQIAPTRSKAAFSSIQFNDIRSAMEEIYKSKRDALDEVMLSPSNVDSIMDKVIILILFNPSFQYASKVVFDGRQ